MEVHCPRCDSIVLVANEAWRMSLFACPSCGECFAADPPDSLEDHPPETGCFQSDVSLEVTDQCWRLVASTRSVTAALPFLMVGTVNGFLVLTLLWFVFSQKSPLSALWFLPLILALLLVVGCLGAMRLGGRIEITIQGGLGTVFTGVGNLGKTQHFDWMDVVEIQDQHTTGRGGEEYHEIVLHTAKKIRTGQFLTKDQAREILQALRQLQRTGQADDAS